MFRDPADSSRSSVYLHSGRQEVMHDKEGSRKTLTEVCGGASVSALPEVLIVPQLCGSFPGSRILAIQGLSGLE